jgi:Fungal Zn(2)-Cys(6) binuclear cluster domain
MEPMVRVVIEESPVSNQVCLNCKARYIAQHCAVRPVEADHPDRKRKCSKTKPSCDLCRKLLLKCVYGPPPPAESDLGLRDSVGQGNGMTTTLIVQQSATHLRQVRATVQDSNSISNWPASANFLATFLKQYQEKGSPASLDIHTSTMKEVLRIIVDNGATIPTLFNEYFRTIGIWLPAIVSEKALYKRLQSEPSSEIALLLLSIFLVVQVPDRSNTKKDFPQTTIYFAANSLHSALVGAGARSLEVVQASVMILLYETGHGMLDQARTSAAFCSQFGMRLLSKRKYQQTGTVDDTDGEKLCWCIMMLDRYFIPSHQTGVLSARA